jgi:hypothetical protein
MPRLSNLVDDEDDVGVGDLPELLHMLLQHIQRQEVQRRVRQMHPKLIELLGRGTSIGKKRHSPVNSQKQCLQSEQCSKTSLVIGFVD